ncbi:outer membrane lipoprotein-sorting protein [Treponema sp.]|uniref:outer membrane lipoprotein-sorting protein n=1 Tax=Treponema sp. TaxID=166 RepID=UPI003F09C7A0
MRLTLKTLTLAAAFAAAVSAFADERGDKIMQRTHDIAKPNYSRSQVVMTLTDKNGSTEQRNILQYGRNKNDITSTVMDFRSPANIKDTRFLQIENKNAADDKWIYLPALKNTRRVNSSEGSKSFMGTDATYDDLSTREMEEDTHEFIKEDTKNGFDCEVVKNVPIDPKSSQYSYRLVWVDKATDCPVYTEFFDKNGKLVKILNVYKIENIDGFNIPMENKLENIQEKHSTYIKIIRIDVKANLSDKIFTQDFLNTGKF